jgi:hypothetical protein
MPGCTAYEEALMAVAAEVARREAEGAPPLEISELVARIRVHGGPQVWPRVWTLDSSGADDADVRSSFEAWLSALPRGAPWRCGVARAVGVGGREIVVALVVETLADLEPLPLRARLGQWLRLRARELVPTRAARVVLLGPRGLPRVLPSAGDANDTRAVFSLDQPGLWRLQVLLDTGAGPRPSLEAWVFVDVEPSVAAGSLPAPGEELEPGPRSGLDAPTALLAMLNQARRSEGRADLRRDARLDQLARDHAEAMQRRALTAHDVGHGLPDERLHQAGIEVHRMGENVAHARTLGLAHRALWDSPSHRGNLLDAGFRVVGLGVAEAPPSLDPAAGVWVCELFADQVTAVSKAARAVTTDLTEERSGVPVPSPSERSF